MLTTVLRYRQYVYAGAAGGGEVCRVFVGHIWDNGNDGGGAARDDGTGRH